MKLTEQHPFITGAPVVAEELQGAIVDITSALTNVESRQLPASSVGLAELGSLEFYTFQNIQPLQTLVRSGLNTWSYRQWLGSGTQPADIKILPGGVYVSGWNQIYNLDTTEGAYSWLVMPSTPGRIVGAATIDSELRCSVATPAVAVDRPYTNVDLYWEFGIFANGSEIARSPKLRAGRHSITIPFVTFSGAEEVTIDIRVRIYFGKQMSMVTTARNIEPFAIHNIHLWANATSK